MHEWCIAADDRTGALEMAAEMAVVFGAPVMVSVGEPSSAAGVVDLGSRTLSPSAAERCAELLELRIRPTTWAAHKIDSTLRGNWAAELHARQVARPRPVVLLPAWPAMGRVCRGGVVHVHGEAVAAVQSSVPLARPAKPHELFHLANDDVVWVDIENDEQLADAAAALVSVPALVAGPAGALGAVARAQFGSGSRPSPPAVHAPALVVCGSATQVSAQQLAALAAARPDVQIVSAPPVDGPLDRAVAARLAESVRPRVQSFGLVVLIGG
ncbi:MAG TPA: hypothetical protein DCR14_10685, partial [Acidimicrobiaceae bacterium]|nr:hypothetical protein [Acidimicrobiaceae bacterium]